MKKKMITIVVHVITGENNVTVFGAILVAFLVSLFIGTKTVCIGLGIVVGVMSFIQFGDFMRWFD